MTSNSIRPLIATAAGMRLTDQLAVAAVPLMGAALFGAGPREIGFMVALQGSAWLLVSIPAGLWVDRNSPTRGLRIGTAIQLVAMVIMLTSLLIGSAALLTVAAFISACAIILYVLSEAPVYQRVTRGDRLPWLNSRVQIAQSTAVLALPVLVGLALREDRQVWLLVAGVAVAALSGLVARRLQELPATPRPERHVLAELKEGIAFVRAEPVLTGILWCSLFWNVAFFALIAQFAPFALAVLKLDPGQIGMAQGMMGVGSVLAAFTVAPLMQRVPPNVILLFGPVSSLAGALLLLVADERMGLILAGLTFFLLGFGPVLWFVCQNTLRQIITPAGLLGRVGSVIQVAMYGVRAFGALAGGYVAGRYGYAAGLMMVVIAFGLSALVVPFSALMRLTAMPVAKEP